MVHRVNWPRCCGKYIAVSQLIRTPAANSRRGASHEMIFVCLICHKVGPFADFVQPFTGDRLWNSPASA